MPQLRRCHEAQQFAFDFGEPSRYATAFEDEDGLVMRYGLDDGEINERLGVLLPGELADLLDIAVAVYMSDRLAVRGGPSQPDWRRALAIQIPVRHIELWRGHDVQDALHERPVILDAGRLADKPLPTSYADSSPRPIPAASPQQPCLGRACPCWFAQRRT